uniref:DnaJ homolog subfamily C member 10 n=1 Tax=Phallusia mammillata TaxID=59560 RepID=A0A6F9DBU0_9ASCI|nr:dnaJ homolog subfamily C member 10 [Phallusia mammillata]
MIKYQLYTCIAVLLLSNCAVQLLAEKDFYEVLGITKDATNKEIRKAFKKLALTMHPDKNINDPEAHNKFVRINEIYEVLKDEEMRKKYDKYGEEGLKDDKRGGRYESYNYYRDEFGIYDDDPEVVTLDGGDFEASIHSGEVWFVNFYSPRCSHCHQLAPTWRKFAEEFSGVVNIGAVNCHDNHWICSNNGIRSYPSLVLFVKNERPVKYQGDRSKKDLTRFVMEHVNVEVVDLWDSNIEVEIAEKPKLPWVVSFCRSETDSSYEDDDKIEGDCPSRITRRKIAGLMSGLANVGSVDCGSSPEICRGANVTKKSGVYHFAVGKFPEPTDESDVHYFQSLDAKEIHTEFMEKLVPGLNSVSQQKLEKHVKNKPALVFLEFSEDSQADQKETSLKKLPKLLQDHRISVVKIDCFSEPWCNEKFHISQDSTLVFKGKGISDFEVYHGRPSVAELSMFAQESSKARLHTLNPSHFKDGMMVENDKPWFVDFFAPWCPPCKALLPELRKASQSLNSINFGTIDCTNFQAVCSEFGIHSYPTTMLFNNSIITEYTGHHNSHGISQFVQDLINPPYEHLTPKTFEALVQRREPGVTWVVDFYANWCGPCRAMLPDWRKMSKMLAGVIKVGAVDCAKAGHSSFCKKQLVDSYPEIRLYPSKKNEHSNPVYDTYEGWNRQAHSLAAWALENVPNGVVTMSYSDFDNNGQPKDKSAWLLDFFTPWCGHCHAFAPKFMMLSFKFTDRVKFGKIDCQSMPSICSKNGVRAYPTIQFYPPKSGSSRPGKESIRTQDPNEIQRIIESQMKQYETKEAKKQKSKKKEKDEL